MQILGLLGMYFDAVVVEVHIYFYWARNISSEILSPHCEEEENFESEEVVSSS